MRREKFILSSCFGRFVRSSFMTALLAASLFVGSFLVKGFFLISFFKAAHGYSTAEALIENMSRNEVKQCENKNNALFQITDKVEASTSQEVARTGGNFLIENLEITLLKCCISESGESYGFVKIYNNKLKKETFNAWLFSRHTSLTGLEDVKFDIILLKCF